MKIHCWKGYIQTTYIVEYEDKILILDSGCRCDPPQIIAFIEETLDRKRNDIRLVAVTHAHPDHRGGAQVFQKRYKIPIAGPTDLNHWYRGFSGFLTYLIDILLTFFVASRRNRKIKNVFFPKTLKFNTNLTPGPIPGFSDWEVINAKGHTNHDLSFYHKSSKTCYIADNLIFHKSGKIFRPYPLWNPTEYKKTLLNYLKLDIDCYLFAHDEKHKVMPSAIKNIIQDIPKRPRTHKNTIWRVLKRLLFSMRQKP